MVADMKIAIIGCGFVADYYMQSLADYPWLELVAVCDRDPIRLAQFCNYYGLLSKKRSLEEILSDAEIRLVVNLTNPDEHYALTKTLLQGNKNVYSEKPLAMNFQDAQELYQLSCERGLVLACAPCSILGETAQTVWHALDEQKYGAVKLVYAEIDDGLVHRMPYQHWISASGHPWPYKDEFEVGCTLEHAGYYIGWLTAYFGPAVSVNTFAACLYPDKEIKEPLSRISPDLSVACITFASGVVARLTCSIIARRNQQLQFFGDRGIIEVHDAWDYRAKVFLKRFLNFKRRMFTIPFGRQRLLDLGYKAPKKSQHPMQFFRGPAEIAAAILEARRPRIPPDYCLHNNEIALAIHEGMEHPGLYQMRSTFEPLEKLPVTG
jgi:predicted dehydrogenase